MKKLVAIQLIVILLITTMLLLGCAKTLRLQKLISVLTQLVALRL